MARSCTSRSRPVRVADPQAHFAVRRAVEKPRQVRGTRSRVRPTALPSMAQHDLAGKNLGLHVIGGAAGDDVAHLAARPAVGPFKTQAEVRGGLHPRAVRRRRRPAPRRADRWLSAACGSPSVDLESQMRGIELAEHHVNHDGQLVAAGRRLGHRRIFPPDRFPIAVVHPRVVKVVAQRPPAEVECRRVPPADVDFLRHGEAV